MQIARPLAPVLALAAILAAGARADVFVSGPATTLADGLLPIFKALQSSPLPGGNRVFLVNENRLMAQRSRSASDVHTLLDRIQDALEKEDEERAAGGELDEFSELAAFDRPFRSEGPGWGIIGRLAGPAPALGEDSVLAHLADGKGLGPAAAGGFVTMATQRGPRAGSDLWTLRFDETFDPMKLMAPSDGDAPGSDLPGIERFPGTRRVMSFSELSSFGNRHAVAYEGRGSTRARARHFREALAAEGYVLASEKSQPGLSMLEFSRADGDLTIYSIRPAPDHPDAIDLIQIQPREYTKR